MASLSSPIVLAGVAGLATFLTVHHIPEYVPIGSTTLTFIACFTALVTLSLTYSIILYPKFLSPLRHLPTPPVSLAHAGFQFMSLMDCRVPAS